MHLLHLSCLWIALLAFSQALPLPLESASGHPTLERRQVRAILRGMNEGSTAGAMLGGFIGIPGGPGTMAAGALSLGGVGGLAGGATYGGRAMLYRAVQKMRGKPLQGCNTPSKSRSASRFIYQELEEYPAMAHGADAGLAGGMLFGAKLAMEGGKYGAKVAGVPGALVGGSIGAAIGAPYGGSYSAVLDGIKTQAEVMMKPDTYHLPWYC